MDKKTYQKMTKKRPFRGLKLFAQKYLNKHRVFIILAKMHLVREVRHHSVLPFTSNDLLNKVKLLDDKITVDRGVFNLSYYGSGTISTNDWWYESLFRCKRLYTVCEGSTYHLTVQVKSECEEFEVKFNPLVSGRVHRKYPVLCFVDSKATPVLPLDDVEFGQQVIRTKRYQCDFFNARLGVEVKMSVHSRSEIDDAVKELVRKGAHQVQNFIEGNIEVINERITGVSNDGEFTSTDGQRLMPNCICHRCGRPVFKSSLGQYTSQCVFCDEDLFEFETIKVDPKVYEDIYEYNKRDLFEILSK